MVSLKGSWSAVPLVAAGYILVDRSCKEKFVWLPRGARLFQCGGKRITIYKDLGTSDDKTEPPFLVTPYKIKTDNPVDKKGPIRARYKILTDNPVDKKGALGLLSVPVRFAGRFLQLKAPQTRSDNSRVATPTEPGIGFVRHLGIQTNGAYSRVSQEFQNRQYKMDPNRFVNIVSPTQNVKADDLTVNIAKTELVYKRGKGVITWMFGADAVRAFKDPIMHEIVTILPEEIYGPCRPDLLPPCEPEDIYSPCQRHLLPPDEPEDKASSGSRSRSSSSSSLGAVSSVGSRDLRRTKLMPDLKLPQSGTQHRGEVDMPPKRRRFSSGQISQVRRQTSQVSSQSSPVRRQTSQESRQSSQGSGQSSQGSGQSSQGSGQSSQGSGQSSQGSGQSSQGSGQSSQGSGQSSQRSNGDSSPEKKQQQNNVGEDGKNKGSGNSKGQQHFRSRWSYYY